MRNIGPKTRFDIYIQLNYIDEILSWMKKTFNDLEINSNKINKVSSSAPEAFRKGFVRLPLISCSYAISVTEINIRSFECCLLASKNIMYAEIEENRIGIHKHLKGKQLHFAVRLKVENENKNNSILGIVEIENPLVFFCALEGIKSSVEKELNK